MSSVTISRTTCFGKHTAWLRHQNVSADDHRLTLSLAWSPGGVCRPHSTPQSAVAGIGKPACTSLAGPDSRGPGACSPPARKAYVTSSWQQGLCLLPRTLGPFLNRGPQVSLGDLGQGGRLVWLSPQIRSKSFLELRDPPSTQFMSPPYFYRCKPTLLRLWDVLPCHSVNYKCCWRHAPNSHFCPRGHDGHLACGFNPVPRIVGQILNRVSTHLCRVL